LMEIEVEQLEDNLYVLRGGGGNSAAFITSDGVVLVDTKVVGWGQALIDTIGELTPNPITTIINTHSHFDHVSGNVEFPASVDIVAHENTARLMDEWNRPNLVPPDLEIEDVFETNPGRGMPDRMFSDRMTLGSGADQVDLYYFGRAHTGGDTWVVFPSLRTMHAGDAFPGKQIPIMDSSNGGSGVEFADTLNTAYATVTDIDTIITGHGTVMTWADLEEYARFVAAFVDHVREGKAAGQSTADVAGSWDIPATFSGYVMGPWGEPELLQLFAQVIYDELP
jgi:cyclase